MLSVIGSLLITWHTSLGAVSAEELRLDHVERVTDDDRLAQGSIWDAEQDRLGFLWFATTDALVRYDGYEARVYRHDPKGPGLDSSRPGQKGSRGPPWHSLGLDRGERAEPI